MNREFSTAAEEFAYIDAKMKDIFEKYGHLTMLFDYRHDELLKLLSEGGYDVKEKTLLGKKQITVTSLKSHKNK